VDFRRQSDTGAGNERFEIDEKKWRKKKGRKRKE
jgi:hypothetical protein